MIKLVDIKIENYIEHLKFMGFGFGFRVSIDYSENPINPQYRYTHKPYIYYTVSRDKDDI